jgi:hypothetical protein
MAAPWARGTSSWWRAATPWARGTSSWRQLARRRLGTPALVELWFPLAAPPLCREHRAAIGEARRDVLGRPAGTLIWRRGVAAPPQGTKAGTSRPPEFVAVLVVEGQRRLCQPGHVVEEAPPNLGPPGGESEEGSADRRRRRSSRGCANGVGVWRDGVGGHEGGLIVRTRGWLTILE